MEFTRKSIVGSCVAGAFLVGAGLTAARAEDAGVQSRNDFPSPCNSGEYVVLSAKVRVVDAKGDPSGPEKLVSLCADRPQEPFASLTYRLGDPGAPDISVTATSANKFMIADEGYSPHDGADVVWFRQGAFNYYVSEATGQGVGVNVYVYKNGAKIADLGTGFDETKIFNGIPIAFDRVRSPIFLKRSPTDAIN